MSAVEEIVALRRELDAAQVQLRERTQWKCACGGTDCAGQEENKRLRAEVERLRKESDVHVKIINDADRELEQAGIETENIIRQVPPAEGIRQLRAEVERLRAIVSKCVEAIGNGSAVSTDCSLGFMEHGECGAEIACDRFDFSRHAAQEAHAETLRLLERALNCISLTDDTGLAISAHIELCAEIRAHLAAHRQTAQEDNKRFCTLALKVAPIASDSALTGPWQDMGDGYLKGRWAEDGSPYQIKCPPQLVPALLAAQELATIEWQRIDAAREAQQ